LRADGEEATADRAWNVLGLDDVFGGGTPEAKDDTVRRSRTCGTIASVGDGSNDAPARLYPGNRPVGPSRAQGPGRATDEHALATDDPSTPRMCRSNLVAPVIPAEPPGTP